MNDIVIRAGFHPEVKREYNGEHIYAITAERTLPAKGPMPETKFYRLANGVWVKDMGNDKYVSDWTNEERWGLVEEKLPNGESKTLGFMILRVDRQRGLL